MEIIRAEKEPNNRALVDKLERALQRLSASERFDEIRKKYHLIKHFCLLKNFKLKWTKQSEQWDPTVIQTDSDRKKEHSFCSAILMLNQSSVLVPIQIVERVIKTHLKVPSWKQLQDIQSSKSFSRLKKEFICWQISTPLTEQTS